MHTAIHPKSTHQKGFLVKVPMYTVHAHMYVCVFGINPLSLIVSHSMTLLLRMQLQLLIAADFFFFFDDFDNTRE